MDKHRCEWLDALIGRRVKIERKNGMYIGYLEYSGGYYHLNKPYFVDNKGHSTVWSKYLFRKSSIKPKYVTILNED